MKISHSENKNKVSENTVACFFSGLFLAGDQAENRLH